MKMLFQTPNIVPFPPSRVWRCAGCDARMSGAHQRLPAFCVFCRAWAQWRREGDHAWERALSGWDDDGGRSAAHDPHPAGAI